jgi:NitT/TauT family transport system substrate-binding protein
VAVFVSLAVLGAVMLSGCVDDKAPSETAMVKLVNCKGQGSMPQTLSTGELDAVIAWEPMPEVLKTKNIGKPIIYSQDLPPNDMWKNHPCCVIVASDDALKNKKLAVNEFLRLMILSTEEINNNKTLAIDASANWLGVDKEVEELSVPNIKYFTDPNTIIDGTVDFVDVLNSQNSLTGKLNISDRERAKNILFDFEPYNEVMKEINENITPEVSGEVPTLKVAYLPTDHHASLFVAAKYPELFKNKYNIYLKEITPKKKYELYENGKKIANIELIQIVEGGAKIMTLMAQKQVDIGFNGVPPAVFAIDKGTNAKIISALHGEGSAVVVRSDIPVNNWDEFVNWIKEQHKEGKQVKIGHPLPVSIQYVMIKKALEAEGITYTE